MEIGLLTTTEAADALRVHRDTVLRYIKHGKDGKLLPVIKLSATEYRIRRSDLDAWLAAIG